MPMSMPTTWNEFYLYVYAFYGRGGVFSMNATMKDIKAASRLYYSLHPKDFYGDSVDRERIGNLLVKKFGYEFPND